VWCHIQVEQLRCHGQRTAEALLGGQEPGASSAAFKLLWSAYDRVATELALDILGLDGLTPAGRPSPNWYHTDDPGARPPGPASTSMPAPEPSTPAPPGSSAASPGNSCSGSRRSRAPRLAEAHLLPSDSTRSLMIIPAHTQHSYTHVAREGGALAQSPAKRMNTTVLLGYGLTESSPALTGIPLDRPDIDRGSAGIPTRSRPSWPPASHPTGRSASWSSSTRSPSHLRARSCEETCTGSGRPTPCMRMRIIPAPAFHPRGRRRRVMA
jgi:hypothetical protein